MKSRISLENGFLMPLRRDIVEEMMKWEYGEPYEEYSIKGHEDEYLLDETTWGTEQFCMVVDDVVVGQVACQFEDDNLWVGWSMAPELCGQGNGAVFVNRCVEELRRIKGYTGPVFLRVSARNKRAVKAYEKAGFRYVNTIQDEIAYSNNIEDFWVMQRDF